MHGSSSCRHKVRNCTNSLRRRFLHSYTMGRPSARTQCSSFYHLVPAGRADTATLMVLSETLDIDAYMYVAPDLRVSSPAVKDTIPKFLRPLVFRKSTHQNAIARKVHMRYRDGHIIYLEPLGDKQTVGQGANHKHYLTGTHDVATGMCDPYSRTFMALFIDSVCALECARVCTNAYCAPVLKVSRTLWSVLESSGELRTTQRERVRCVMRLRARKCYSVCCISFGIKAW
jgi:hypothetical protein